MEAEPRPRDTSVDEAIAALSRLVASHNPQLLAVREQLAELRRDARASGARCRGRPSTDEVKYRLGSIFFVLEASALDDLALLGLLYNADVALVWLAEARRESGAGRFFDLIDTIFGDPERMAWCRRWGEVVWWERNRELYAASVQSFLDSGKADDPQARWRSKPPTADQLYLIETICRVRSVFPPDQPTRGDAFDWIREEGGNPRYRQPPTHPPDWRRCGDR